MTEKICPLCGSTGMIVCNGVLTCTQCSFKKTEQSGKMFANDNKELKRKRSA